MNTTLARAVSVSSQFLLALVPSEPLLSWLLWLNDGFGAMSASCLKGLSTHTTGRGLRMILVREFLSLRRSNWSHRKNAKWFGLHDGHRGIIDDQGMSAGCLSTLIFLHIVTMSSPGISMLLSCIITQFLHMQVLELGASITKDENRLISAMTRLSKRTLAKDWRE